MSGKQEGRTRGKGTVWKAVWKEIGGTCVYLLAVFLGIYLVITYVGQRTTVRGESMEPTLSDGDNLIADKISYRFSDPKRFDIIVFPYRYEKNTYYIKRIIGLPGETVQIDAGGNILIDGQILEEGYGLEPMAYAGMAAEPVRLAEDEYFVLGDNRNNSSDSRDPSVGKILRKEIIGRAWVRIWPLSRFGKLSAASLDK